MTIFTARSIICCLMFTLAFNMFLNLKPYDARAQEMSDAELAQEAAQQSSNPLGGDFFVILNQFNFDFLQGDITTETRNLYSWTLQPVIPIPVKFVCEYCIWVNRPTFNFIFSAEIPSGLNVNFPPSGGISIPDKPPAGLVAFDSQGGFGDIIYFSLLGISKPMKSNFFGDGALVLAPGFTTMWPAGSKEFSTNRYSAGPAFVASFIGKKYILGVLGQHWWSYAERNRGNNNPKVNQSLIQYFYYMNFPGAWQVGGAPQITIDFEANSGNKVELPIGLGIQKTILISLGEKIKLPIKLGVEVQYYVVNADTYGNEWRIQFTLAPIIPAPWADLSGMGGP